VMGDNGTTEEGVLPPWDPAAAKESMAEGGLGVPLIVAGPGVAQPGVETDALVSAVDVWPTVMEWLGVDAEPTEPTEPTELVGLDGQSFAAQLEDPQAPGRSVVYSEYFAPFGFGPKRTDLRAVRGPRFKLGVNDTTGLEVLYDLQGRSDDGPDLLTQGPLSAEAEQALAELRLALDDHRQRLVP
jgi:arylsulfatase A-like enzyme